MAIAGGKWCTTKSLAITTKEVLQKRTQELVRIFKSPNPRGKKKYFVGTEKQWIMRR